MKAILIVPETQSMAAIDISGREDIARLIGFDTIESDAIGTREHPSHLGGAPV